MLTNLFLQGPRRIGKSTLLRSVLEDIRGEVGGYFVQRLFCRGEHVGFRLVDVESREPYALNREIDPGDLEVLDQVIMGKTGAGRWQSYPQVFETAGVEILEGARRGGKRIVLLDELGNIELGAPGFQEAVLALLASSKKVLGVLKLADNPFLRKIREREDVEIHDLKPASYPSVLARVRDFVEAGSASSINRP
ncbi:MAG: nucleoside-triphosphatase [bacterium]